MQLQRTTLRIKTDLKKAAEKKALEENITLQELFNRALSEYLQNSGKKKASDIIFKTHNIGKPLDNLTRADYYSDPK